MSEQVNMAAHYEHEIPEGYEAKIEGNKVIIELKESEDEKIRKEIIDYFYGCIKRNSKSGFRVEQIKGWIAYLEKQKDILGERAKNITANMLEDGIGGIQRELIEFLSNTVNASWVDVIKSADAYAERIRNIIEKQKEQKPTEWSDSVAKEMFIKALERAVEQTKNGYELTDCDKHSWWEDFKAYSGIKPTEWSEKDEARKERLISIVKRALHGNEYCLLSDKGATELITWLNALHERLNLQPKQEWSKEDEDMLNSIIATCQLAAQDRYSRPAWHLFEMQEKFLKSFRPQQKQDGVWITKEQFEQIKSASYLTGKLDHWKPSKEQIAALNCAIQTMQHQLNLGDKRLLSLYNDLKKLILNY